MGLSPGCLTKTMHHPLWGIPSQGDYQPFQLQTSHRVSTIDTVQLVVWVQAIFSSVNAKMSPAGTDYPQRNIGTWKKNCSGLWSNHPWKFQPQIGASMIKPKKIFHGFASGLTSTAHSIPRPASLRFNITWMLRSSWIRKHKYNQIQWYI